MHALDAESPGHHADQHSGGRSATPGRQGDEQPMARIERQAVNNNPQYRPTVPRSFASTFDIPPVVRDQDVTREVRPAGQPARQPVDDERRGAVHGRNRADAVSLLEFIHRQGDRAPPPAAAKCASARRHASARSMAAGRTSHADRTSAIPCSVRHSCVPHPRQNGAPPGRTSARPCRPARAAATRRRARGWGGRDGLRPSRPRARPVRPGRRASPHHHRVDAPVDPRVLP